MNNALYLTLALSAGLGLGAFFYGGLWWTVRLGLSLRHPALLFPLSFLIRSVLTLAGFYLVSGGAWQPLLASLLGFMVARLPLSLLTGNAPDASRSEGAGHAP
jgi:F1F0 ATPase subunit 2